MADCLLDRAHRVPPAYLNPRATYCSGDLRDGDVAAHVVRGVDAVCHQASLVGLGVDFDDVVDYVGHNDTATAVLLRALHQRRFTGRLVLASSMVVYGEGRYACAEHGVVPAPARSAERLAAHRFEPTCPVMRRRPRRPAGRRVPPRPTRATCTPPPSCTRSTCAPRTAESTTHAVVALRYHNVYGPRMPRDTPYAGVAAIFRSAYERGEAPTGLRGRRATT